MHGSWNSCQDAYAPFGVEKDALSSPSTLLAFEGVKCNLSKQKYLKIRYFYLCLNAFSQNFNGTIKRFGDVRTGDTKLRRDLFLGQSIKVVKSENIVLPFR